MKLSHPAPTFKARQKMKAEEAEKTSKAETAVVEKQAARCYLYGVFRSSMIDPQ
jgi:hypothetical protein